MQKLLKKYRNVYRVLWYFIVMVLAIRTGYYTTEFNILLISFIAALGYHYYLVIVTYVAIYIFKFTNATISFMYLVLFLVFGYRFFEVITYTPFLIKGLYTDVTGYVLFYGMLSISLMTFSVKKFDEKLERIVLK